MEQRSGINQANGLTRRIFYWWANRPAVHVFVLVGLSVLAIIGYVKPSLIRDRFVSQQVAEPEPLSQLGASTQSAPSATRLPNVRPFQVADGECIVVATCDNFFDEKNLRAIRLAVADIEALPQVSRVLWIDSIPGLNLFGLPEPILPRNNSSSRQMQQGRERALENPLAVGQLISQDGKTLLLHLRIDWFHATTDESCTTELRETAEAAAARVSGAEIDFKVTGRAPLYLMMAHNHLRDSWRYQAIGYSFMILTALILFRGVSAVTIVTLAPAMGVFWTMGILHFFNLQDNPFNDIIVPVLISLVGLADAVHMMVEIRIQRASGLETRQAAQRGVARVGFACALTSLTTAIGFGSLAWAHHQVVQDFGWCCVLGVSLTFISVLTVVPLGCHSPLGRRLHVGVGTSLIDGQLKKIGTIVSWVLRHDRGIARLGIAATVALVGICTQLQPDERRYSGLSESGEAAKALRHLDSSLGGLEFGNVEVSWAPEASEGELLEVLLEVDGSLQRESLVGHPLGLHQLLAVLPGEGPADERMTLLELLPASLKRAFYIPERRMASVQFRVKDIGIAKYVPVFERIESELEQISQRHPHFSLELQGNAVRRWRGVHQIVKDLVTSLGTASIIIWLIITVVFRSIRIGLISIVPNFFPLVATGSLLLFTGQYLEIVTVCVFTICIGIAVDDTIHFLTRYMEESANADSHEEAIKKAFTGVGSALLMTTIVLVTGMTTAIFGDARDARIFGIMGAITLTSALFADIFFLPALLKRFDRRLQKAPESTS